jgi:hypothetical protein
VNLIDQLRDCIGMWVAVDDEKVLYAGGTPGELLEWLAENGATAKSVFCVVPLDQDMCGHE